jgi:hypothetical protein
MFNLHTVGAKRPNRKMHFSIYGADDITTVVKHCPVYSAAPADYLAQLFVVMGSNNTYIPYIFVRGDASGNVFKCFYILVHIYISLENH